MGVMDVRIVTLRRSFRKKNIMKREKVYLVDLSGSGFRCGRPAEIIGVEMCTPDGLEPRLCYHLRWEDSKEDWKPVGEPLYEIRTFSQILSGDYSKV